MRHLVKIVGLALLLGLATTAHAQKLQPNLPEGTESHRNLQYVKEGHERQKLDLFLPKRAEGPAPVIVWIHGGAWRGGSKDDGNPALSFLNKGYAVASINYRLSQHATFPAQIIDCKAALRWLRANAKTYHIDPDRIAVWGASAGGHLAALLGTSGDVKELEGTGGNLDQSSRVQAVIDWFGPTDLAQLGNPENRDSPIAHLLGGLARDDQDKAAQANPITFITKDDPPFLIMHGDKDQIVPISQSELLVDALKKAGVDAAFYTVKGAGHGGPEFRKVEERPMMEVIAEFLDKHLQKGK